MDEYPLKAYKGSYIDVRYGTGIKGYWRILAVG
jgi:hypothetical protein